MTVKSFQVPSQGVQAIVDSSGHPHPWYMSGMASIDASGSVRTTTHLESHIAFSGFTGGMVAAFLNSDGESLYTTPILQYGVDGRDSPRWLGATPSPRDASASFQVSPSVYDQTDRININLFHAPKNRLGTDIGLGLATAEKVVGWIVALFGSSDSSTVVSSTSNALSVQPPVTPSIQSGDKYAIHVPSGQFLTAVNGGGMVGGRSDLPLHTDATQIGPWEKFKFVNLGGDSFAIQTVNGHYLTAVNAGGMGESANQLPLHTDATQPGPSETFTINAANGSYTIQTANGHYVTAVNGGGVGTPADNLPLHTDATQIGPWEKFALVDISARRRMSR